MVATPSTSSQTKGVVRQVIGPVLDVEFPAGKLPKILNALRIEAKNPAGQDIALTAEVQQLLGDHRVRAVAMSGTDGLVRGMEAVDTGAPISVPVGEATLGRIFNVLGEPVDEQGPVKTKDTAPIHRAAPKLTDLETKPKVFETGIKVIDLLAPYRQGGKVGLFGGAGVGKTVLIQELINLSEKGELDIDIKVLITNKDDAGCIKRAESVKIPYKIIRGKDFSQKELFELEIINTLINYDVELIVMAGWMKIVSTFFINKFRNKIINIHPSLLPAYKGGSAIKDSLLMVPKLQVVQCIMLRRR